MIWLLIGGMRSGKSQIGEDLAARLDGPVTVVVPAVVDDPDFADRVRAHRARRPSSWTTIECGSELPTTVRAVDGTLLIDSLGSWIAGCDGFAADPDVLVEALRTRGGSTVVVTEEVGLAVHPPTELGRRFADRLGALNLAVAAIADEVLLVVAGRVTRLDRPDETPAGH